MGNRPMTAGTRRTDRSPRAKTNLYLKRFRQMGKSLITASTQRTYSSLMAMSQRIAMLRVIVEQQTNTYPQVISVQQTNFDLMAVLQRTATPMVIAYRRTYLTP